MDELHEFIDLDIFVFFWILDTEYAYYDPRPY